MDIYKNIEDNKYKEFEKLLVENFSKTKIEEGKISTGTITKITEKHFYCLIDGMKSEALIDISEIKTTYPNKQFKENEKLDIYVEKLEDSKGEVIVSASRAQKIKGFYELQKAFEANETIKGKFVSKIKGGLIVSHVGTQTLMFCPGSAVDNKILKSFDHLFGSEHEFKIIKCDGQRGNILCSRREVLSSVKKEDKAKILEKYSLNQTISGTCKGWSSFGAFFEVNNEIDVMVHLQNISFSRINSPDEVFTVGEVHKMKIIEINKDKQQISASIKALSPDPFDDVSSYEVGKIYKAKVIKIVEYGCFAELDGKPGLTCLCHSSSISWLKKNADPAKHFKVNQVYDFMVTDIDREKKRIAISFKDVSENPYSAFEKQYSVNSKLKCIISSIKDFSIYLDIPKFEITGFMHATDLSYVSKPEEAIKNLKKGDELEVVVLSINTKDQKIKFGRKQLEDDPFKIFQDKKVKDVLTCKVLSTNPKGILVSPEGSNNIQILIKKNQIAINVEDQRQTRFVAGDRIDAAISELHYERRKVTLSIKLLEEIQKKEALEKYGSEGSGKHLPFSQLSEKIESEKNKEKIDKKKE